MNELGESRPVLQRKLGLVVRKLYDVSRLRRNKMGKEHTIELVKVAGTAMSIHQTILVKNSFPLPLTRAFTIAPSISATRTLIKVLITRKKV